jgi:hypothetical protein
LASVIAPAMLGLAIPASAQSGGANAWNNYREHTDPGYDLYRLRSGGNYNPDYYLPFVVYSDPNKPRRYKHPDDTRFPCRDGGGNIVAYVLVTEGCPGASPQRQSYAGNENSNPARQAAAEGVAHTESNTVRHGNQYCVVTMTWDRNSNYLGSKEIC